MYGLDPEIIRNLKEVFSKFEMVDKVILYGSRAMGTYRTGSDIDITLFGKNLSNQTIFSIQDEIEELYLPYSFDISIFDRIDNEDLIDHIGRVGKVFYARKKELPEGWEWKRVGDICTVIAGQSPESRYYNKSEMGLPFYQGKKEFSGKYIKIPIVWTTKITKEAEKDDILMSVRAPVGPVNFSTEKICIGRGLAAIRAGKTINKDYLFNFFKKHENEIVQNEGAVFNSINKSKIEGIKLPFPPTEEQKRIVSILDKALESIEKAKENAEKNLNSAKELFESYLNKIFEDGKLKAQDGEWEERKLGDICNIIGGGTPSKKNKDFYTGNIFWATVRDMKNDFIKDTEFKINKEAVLKSSTNIIEKGNVVIATRVGLGKACLLDVDVAINQDLKGIIPKTGVNLQENYLFFWFKSIKNSIIKEGTGATVKGVKLPFVKSLKITVPSLVEQNKIVLKLNSAMNESQKLEELYQKKIDSLEELKGSILQKAFEGEL
jgi:type I restriction enzyme S subunit